MSAPLPHSIIELVGKRWLKKDQPEVLRLLAEFCLDDEAYRERVLRCIVGLAGRDMSQLLHFLECAREDPRNLIYWYEHGEQSRSQFLSR
jgi:hypothetical protein